MRQAKRNRLSSRLGCECISPLYSRYLQLKGLGRMQSCTALLSFPEARKKSQKHVLSRLVRYQRTVWRFVFISSDYKLALIS